MLTEKWRGSGNMPCLFFSELVLCSLMYNSKEDTAIVRVFCVNLQSFVPTGSCTMAVLTFPHERTLAPAVSASSHLTSIHSACVSVVSVCLHVLRQFHRLHQCDGNQCCPGFRGSLRRHHQGSLRLNSIQHWKTHQVLTW